MRRPRRTAVIAVSVLVGVVALGSRISFDAGALRQRFETAASGPLGLRVSVLGSFGIKFQGHLLFVMRDVHVRNLAGEEILSAERATVAIALFPLLFNRFNVHRVALSRPRIAIERGRDGTLNWARRAKPRGTMPVLAGTKLSLREGSVHYRDEASGTRVDADDVALEVRDLRRNGRTVPHLAGGLSFRATLRSKEIRTAAISFADVSVEANSKKGGVELNPVAMNVFGGEGRGTLYADLSDSIPRYRLRYSLRRFSVYECLRSLSPDTIATGTMDFAANVSSSGRAPAEWARNLEGDVIVSGREIMLHGHDLDKDVSRLSSNHLLNLAGVGSFFFVGPLGIAVTKGYDLTRLVGHSGGSTQVSAFVSSWGAEGGELRAKDVAMATSKNRVALTGSLDLVQQRFDSVSVAVVDEDGCAKVKQELRGTFQEPEITKPTLLTALLGPAEAVYEQVKGLVPSGPCTVFYAGTVAPPE